MTYFIGGIVFAAVVYFIYTKAQEKVNSGGTGGDKSGDTKLK